MGTCHHPVGKNTPMDELKNTQDMIKEGHNTHNNFHNPSGDNGVDSV